MFVASDVAALVRYTRQVVHLDDGELAVAHAPTASAPSPSTPGPTTSSRPSIDWDESTPTIGRRLRPLHAQGDPRAAAPRSSGRCAAGWTTGSTPRTWAASTWTPREAREIRRVKILGCGSAYYAGPDRRAADRGAGPGPRRRRAGLGVPLPQPGDRPGHALRRGQPVRRDLRHAGRRAGDPAQGRPGAGRGQRRRQRDRPRSATAASTCTPARRSRSPPPRRSPRPSVAFALLALHLGRIRDLSPADGQRIVDGLRALPARSRRSSQQDDQIAELAAGVSRTCRSMMFIGRVRGWPVAREGAQKLKEVSYVHAEAYPAAELKHGPLALISPEMPTVAIVPDDELLDKNLIDARRDQGARRARSLALGPPGAAGRARRPHDRRAARTSRSWTRSCCRSRCSCWPTTPPWCWATMSTSRATWRRASPSSSGTPDGGGQLSSSKRARRVSTAGRRGSPGCSRPASRSCTSRSSCPSGCAA